MLGDGPYYEVMAENLADFRRLAELLAPAKGTIPGLVLYQQMMRPTAGPNEWTRKSTSSATTMKIGAGTMETTSFHRRRRR